MDTTCDICVIGAGPAGCSAALYAGRAGFDAVMLSPTELSGMITRAPNVGNYPSVIEPTPGREILARMRQQALNAGARHLLEAVTGVDFAEPANLRVYAGQVHVARAVIVATGAMGRADMAPGEAEYQGRGVCYCVACDGPLFTGLDVLVVGDDEQAAEEALALSGTSRSVRLVTAAPRLSVSEELRTALEARGNVAVETGLKLDRIVGDAAVTGAVFSDRDGGEQERAADGVFLYLRGASPVTEFLRGAVALDEKGYIITDELCQTSVPGVFAAGDVRSKQARQIVIAAAEGAIAALAAERMLRRGATIRADRGAAATAGLTH